MFEALYSHVNKGTIMALVLNYRWHIMGYTLNRPL